MGSQCLARSLRIFSRVMKVVVPIHNGRISPVLDVARQFLIVESDTNAKQERKKVFIEKTRIVARAKEIVDLGTQVLICGAISWPIEAILVCAGVQVVPNTCGKVEEVLDAFLSGCFDEHSFLMPGCSSRKRWQVDVLDEGAENRGQRQH